MKMKFIPKEVLENRIDAHRMYYLGSIEENGEVSHFGQPIIVGMEAPVIFDPSRYDPRPLRSFSFVIRGEDHVSIREVYSDPNDLKDLFGIVPIAVMYVSAGSRLLYTVIRGSLEGFLKSHHMRKETMKEEQNTFSYSLYYFPIEENEAYLVEGIHFNKT